MKIIIQGRAYEAIQINRASLAQLLALKQTSGLGLDTLKSAADRFEQMIRDPDLSEDDKAIALFSNEESLLAIAAMVWLTRWAAGERLSFEDANDFPLTELNFEPEAGDVEQAPDPQ